MLNRPTTQRMRDLKRKAEEAHRIIDADSASILGDDITICGNLHADTDLRIEGRVEGDISCAHLVQGHSSEIVGAIVAETARIAGLVCGSVTAREVVILKSARVRGDIVYDSLTIEQGAQLDGQLTPKTPQAPTVTRTVGTSDTHLVLASTSALEA